MLVFERVVLYPTPSQYEHIARGCRARAHRYNLILQHFSQDGVTWSRKDADRFLDYPFGRFAEFGRQITQTAIDDLDEDLKRYRRLMRQGKNPRFPQRKKKDDYDSFVIQNKPGSDECVHVEGRLLYIKGLDTPIKISPPVPPRCIFKQVKISTDRAVIMLMDLDRYHEFFTKSRHKGR